MYRGWLYSAVRWKAMLLLCLPALVKPPPCTLPAEGRYQLLVIVCPQAVAPGLRPGRHAAALPARCLQAVCRGAGGAGAWAAGSSGQGLCGLPRAGGLHRGEAEILHTPSASSAACFATSSLSLGHQVCTTRPSVPPRHHTRTLTSFERPANQPWGLRRSSLGYCLPPAGRWRLAQEAPSPPAGAGGKLRGHRLPASWQLLCGEVLRSCGESGMTNAQR